MNVVVVWTHVLMFGGDPAKVARHTSQEEGLLPGHHSMVQPAGWRARERHMNPLKGIVVCVACALALAACGVEENECLVTGTWSINETRSTSSGGLCSEGGDTSTAIAQVTYERGVFRWREGDDEFVGTLNKDSCSATVTTSKTQTGDDGNGGTITITGTYTRKVTFSGSTVDGTTDLTVSSSPTIDGTPCTALILTSGFRSN
jgi:hypothetical protein